MTDPPAPPSHPTATDSWAESRDPRPRSGRGGMIIARRGGLVLAGAALGAVVALLATHVIGTHAVEVQVARQTGSGTPAPDTAEAVAAKLGPSVGTVINLGRNGQAASLGSGLVFGNDGSASYLLTNNHVVAGANSLAVVMPDGHSFHATLVGADSLDDLAVVSVPDASLPQATFGSSAALVVGQPVVAIGSPLGNDGSVTAGVISALHRTITAGDTNQTSEQLEDVLQTDASINPGNSGGPLADTSGNVIGVNVAVAGNSSNIGFSIPADLARRVAEALVAHQKVQHPFLGVEYLDAIEAVEAGKSFSSPGVLITSVTANSPAAAAGLQPGDILVSIDGTNIDNGQTLGGLIETRQNGEKVTFSVTRGGKSLTLTATLEERPSALPSP